MLREAARDFLSAEETPPHLLLPWVSRGPFLFVTQPGRGSGAVSALTRKEQSMNIPSELVCGVPRGDGQVRKPPPSRDPVLRRSPGGDTESQQCGNEGSGSGAALGLRNGPGMGSLRLGDAITVN